jgi:MTH538 TIR-like domain (DUF1863)
MARRAFFSFHHSGDVWRAGQVRNSWVTQDRQDAGFWDSAAWEAVKKKDIPTVQKWIDEQMKGTSVTVVLIGAETSTRPHVGYEIKESHRLGKGMLGIYVHNMKDVNGKTGTKGNNPFANFQVERDGKKILLSDLYPTYDWVNDDGRKNIGDWIEAAAKKAGR